MSQPPPNPILHVLGNSVVDMFMLGITSFPAQDGARAEVGGVDSQPGGNGLNVALAAAQSTATEVHLLTAIGDDERGKLLRSACSRQMPGTIELISAARRGDQTGLSVVAVQHAQPRFLVYPGCSDRIGAAFLRSHLNELAAAQCLHLCGIGLLPGLQLNALVKFLHELRQIAPRILIVLDVNLMAGARNTGVPLWRRIQPLLRQVDFFVPNNAEAIAYSGLSSRSGNGFSAELLRAAAALLNNSVRVATIITRGPLGVLLCERGKPPVSVPAIKVPPRKIVDTVGAGDAWAAGFLCGLIRNLDLPDCCRRGNELAAMSIQSRGGTSGIHPMNPI
ncbi:MAG: PfkB family carbohydrate kinase [Tepidisphaeraceae bacterium]|jgi:sugar/nucleoside kinase (ribokinase family)